MGLKNKRKEAAPTDCRECERRDNPEVRERVRVSEFLEKAIKSAEAKLTSGEFKPTIAEFLKLMQLKKELEQEQDGTKEIKVTWVEPAATSEPEK
jgi:hypothetical protein